MYDNKRRMSFIHEKTRMKKQMLDNVTYPSQQADNFFFICASRPVQELLVSTDQGKLLQI